MKSACVGVLSIIELKNARWNIEKCNFLFEDALFNGAVGFWDSAASNGRIIWWIMSYKRRCRRLGWPKAGKIREFAPGDWTKQRKPSVLIVFIRAEIQIGYFRTTSKELDNCAPPGYYSASSGNSFPTFRNLYIIPKRRQGIAATRCVLAQKSAVLICFASEVWNNAK